MEPDREGRRSEDDQGSGGGQGGRTRKERRPPRIEVREDFCKACGICVHFCPTNVLAMKQDCVAVVELAACTKCMMCELRCPDFAISVHEVDPEEDTT